MIEIEESVTGLVLDFVRQMNELQSRYGPQINQTRGDGAGRVFASYRQEAEDIYARFLTERKRSCYFGICQPPFFHAVEGAASWAVEVEKDHAAVTVLPQEGSMDFRFLLREKGGGWRINSFQQRYRARQRLYQWTYGSF